MKDPYYQKILDGLSNVDRPQEFEDCVSDLLRDAYPGLVPIRGGQDAGMDGAIADGEGEHYPLIATTAKNVIRNLTKNLESYRKQGGGRNKAVVATSRELTPRRLQNLKDRAQEFGVVLVQIHDQRDLANRLYRNSRWTKQLLGITGQPSALSAVPETRRPLLEIELVGRQADLDWLTCTGGDRLLVGQPGAGKTYLLLQLVRSGKALFLASDDVTAVANAVRDLQPKIILVDDAQFSVDWLDRLRRMRTEIGAEFSLLATTWPGKEEEIADALSIVGQGERIRHLELLTRAEIVEVLRKVGVNLPDDNPHLRLLVDQSANKPGLAVLLGSLWLRGEYLELGTGKALQKSLLPTLKRILDHDPIRLLACFALGGDMGQEVEKVREFLELNRDEMQHRVLSATAGGVLSAGSGDRLFVEPEPLRSPLIGTVFFEKPALSYKDLLATMEDLPAATKTLVIASLRGAPIPRNELRSLVEQHGRDDAWFHFAHHGDDDARWVLDNFPGRFADIAPTLLRPIPRDTIPRLLESAEQADGPLHSQPFHPLRILQDWVREINGLRRREILVDLALQHLESGRDRTVALRACLIALAPKLEVSGDAATKDRIIIRQALLSADKVSKASKLWERIYGHLFPLSREIWSELETTLGEWVHPETFGKPADPETETAYRVFARRVISDLSGQATDHPGLRLALKIWAHRIGLSLDLDVEPEFRTLFPPEHHLNQDNWREEKERQREAASELARRFSQMPPERVASRLSAYMEEADVFLNQRLGWDALPAFFHALSEGVEHPANWLDAFIKYELPPAWLKSFLGAIEKGGMDEEILLRCLAVEQYAWMGAQVSLRVENVSEEILSAALAKIPEHLVETSVLRGEIPLPTLLKLLRHPNPIIAIAAAAGEWSADPARQVREEVVSEWKVAMLRIGVDTDADRLEWPSLQSSIKRVFSQEPALSKTWLEERLKDGGIEYASENGIIATAIKALDRQARHEMIPSLQEECISDEFVALIVTSSVDLYQLLLQQAHLRRFHLVPLEGKAPDERWVRLAEVALKWGRTPVEIAEASFSIPPFGMTIAGSGLQHWQRWLDGFQALEENSDGLLGEVANHGVRLARTEVEKAMRVERHRKIHGVFV